MGEFYKKYKQFYDEFNAVKKDIYDDEKKAADPKGFLEYERKQRWYRARLTSVRNAIGFSLYPLEKFRPALEKVLGQEGAKARLQEAVKEENYYRWAVKTIRKFYPGAEDLLSEEEKRGLSSNPEKIKKSIDRMIQNKSVPSNIMEEILPGYLCAQMRSTEHELAIIEELDKGLSEEESKKLLDQLVEVVDPDNLTMEEKITHTHTQRIQQLKASAAQVIKDDPVKQKRYLHALEEADRLLVESIHNVKEEYCHREHGIQNLRKPIEMALLKKGEGTEKGKRYQDLYNTKDVAYSEHFYAVKPNKQENYEELLNEKIKIGEKTKEGYRKIFAKMDEMKLLDYPFQESGEDDYKILAFNKYSEEKSALKEAIAGGDPDKIIEAQEKLAKTEADMEELYRIAKEHFSENEYSFPGNLDSIRNENLPIHFTSQLMTTAQVNSAFLVYQRLRLKKIEQESFLENPAGDLVKETISDFEKVCFENKTKNISFDDALDVLAMTGKYSKIRDEVAQATPMYAFGRSLYSAGILEREESGKVENAIVANKLNSMTETVLLCNQRVKYGYLSGDCYQPNDKKERMQTLQNLMVASDQDRNLNSMLAGIPQTDMMGRVIGESFDADAYLKSGKGDLEGITKRAEKILNKQKGIASEGFGGIAVADVRSVIMDTYMKALEAMPEKKYGPDAAKYAQMESEIFLQAERILSTKPENLKETKEYLLPQAKKRNEELEETKYEVTERIQKYMERHPEAAGKRMDAISEEMEKAKSGVWFGSKLYDDAVTAYNEAKEAFKSLDEQLNSVGMDHAEKIRRITKMREKMEESKEKIQAYLDRKRGQGLMNPGASIDEKPYRRISAMVNADSCIDLFNGVLERRVNDIQLQIDEEMRQEMKAQKQEMERQDKEVVANRITELENEQKTNSGLKKASAKLALESMKNLNEMAFGEFKGTPEEIWKAKHDMASVLIQMLLKEHPEYVESMKNLGEEGLKNQASYLAESKEFQKALNVNVSQEMIRNFIADDKGSKRVLENILSAMNQQAEKEINKNEQKKKQTKELGSNGVNGQEMGKGKAK